MYENLRKLSGAGVAIWLDDLSRKRLQTGTLADHVANWNVVGVTSNPTIFQKAISDSSRYDEELRAYGRHGMTVDEIARMLTTHDVRAAADVLRPAYDRSAGVDGRVSIEVDPRLAGDTERTIDEARLLWWLVDRPNIFVKIPATPAGLPAITACLAEGLSINVTLIFSLDRYDQVMDAFLAGLEQAKQNGHDLSSIASVASFFVSRVDTEVDKRLDKLGTPEAAALRGKAAIANARLAFEHYERVVASPRWQALADAGARPQRPLWASTGVKDPAYPDTMYVDELITNGVINTMPQATLEAVADHGTIAGDTVRGRYQESQAVLDGLEALGISYLDVVDVLETEGVEKFTASWNELLGSIKAEMERLA
ncbi:MAG: transaldolase [Sporichthyaceae bacterium]|nr:transaldolase [Sporichthyaceae bacterium]